MAASSAAAPSKLTQNFDRAREEYARAQEIMVERAMELERMQKELNAAQREVLDRERKLMEAAVKDGLTATTATAAMVALNPATAAKVRPLPVRTHTAGRCRGFFLGPTLSRCTALLMYPRHDVCVFVLQVGTAATGASKATAAVALGWKQHLIAGGVARGVAVGSLFPVDSIKTKMQIGQKVCCAAPTRVRRVCCTPAGARNPSDTAWTLQQFCFA